ncbi:MAG: hypothetical protein WC831_03295 [Parcubacteria group bacterium]
MAGKIAEEKSRHSGEPRPLISGKCACCGEAYAGSDTLKGYGTNESLSLPVCSPCFYGAPTSTLLYIAYDCNPDADKRIIWVAIGHIRKWAGYCAS